MAESKDSYAIISLHKYLNDAAELSKIDHRTITALKKTLTNIDVFKLNLICKFFNIDFDCYFQRPIFYTSAYWKSENIGFR